MTPEDIADSEYHFDVVVNANGRRTSTLIEAPTERDAYLGVLRSEGLFEEPTESRHLEILRNDTHLEILGLIVYSDETREIDYVEEKGMYRRGGITVKVQR